MSIYVHISSVLMAINAHELNDHKGTTLKSTSIFFPVLEVCQFARDASVAEAWLVAQEPYVTSRDLGLTVDEVEKLLKRHEAFEKSTAAWEERFSALERLTTVTGTPSAQQVSSGVTTEGQSLTSSLLVLFPSSAGADGSEVAAAGHGADHQGAALGQGEQVICSRGRFVLRLVVVMWSLHTVKERQNQQQQEQQKKKTMKKKVKKSFRATFFWLKTGNNSGQWECFCHAG